MVCGTKDFKCIISWFPWWNRCLIFKKKFNFLGFGSDEAGPSGINDYDEQEENVDKMETNDADSIQVHFPNECPPNGRLENVK